MQIKLKYVIEDVDRHGNVRCYVRVPGQPKVRLRAHPGTEDFMAAYHAAIGGRAAGPHQAREVKPGSFRHLCQLYFGAKAFKRLDVSTRNWQRRHLEAICQTRGHNPVILMRSKHVRAIIEEIDDTPAAANARRKALRSLFRWAVKAERLRITPPWRSSQSATSARASTPGPSMRSRSSSSGTR